MTRSNALTIAAVVAGSAALAFMAKGDDEQDETSVPVPRRNAPESENRRWVPSEHVLTVDDTRSVKKIDAFGQPCTVWLKLPPGQSYQVRRTSGTAGVRNVAYHELEDATWSAFEVYRAGEFKLAVRDNIGKYLGHFQIKVTNLGRG